MSIGGVVITTGVACAKLDLLKVMIEMVLQAGLQPVLRINTAHHGSPLFQQILDVTCEARYAYPEGEVLLQMDLPGPKIRARIASGVKERELKPGDEIFFGHEGCLPQFSFNNGRELLCPNLPEVLFGLEAGMDIVMADGAFRFQVKEVVEQNRLFLLVVLRAKEVFKDYRGVSFPKRRGIGGICCPTQEDLDLVPLVVSSSANIVAQSFTLNGDSIRTLRSQIEKCGGRNVQVMAKPENRDALYNWRSICEASDSLMVPRGDLAVEVSLLDLPFIQQILVIWGRSYNKPVTIGTGLLRSMLEDDEYARSEATDVTVAIQQLWGTPGFVMLTNETCEGKHPAETVAVILATVQRNRKYLEILHHLVPTDLDRFEEEYRGLLDSCT